MKFERTGSLTAFASATFRAGNLYDAAEWYDVDYAGYMAEDAFYRMLVEQHVGEGGALVEVGAGTGRLCLGYAAAGTRVHAVEPAPPMLDLLHKKALKLDASAARVTSECSTAESFVGPSDARIDLVTFPFNGLLHLHSRAELQRSLSHIYSLLAAGGVFAVDVTAPYWDAMGRQQVEWGRLDERTHPKTGQKILTCDRAKYDGPSKVLTTDFRFLGMGDKEGVDLQIEQRMWTVQEIQAAVEDVGFTIEHRFGDVDLVPFRESSPRFLLSAKKNG